MRFSLHVREIYTDRIFFLIHIHVLSIWTLYNLGTCITHRESKVAMVYTLLSMEVTQKHVNDFRDIDYKHKKKSQSYFACINIRI